MEPGAAAIAGFSLGFSSGGLCFWSCAAVMAPYVTATSPEPSRSRRWSTLPGIMRTLAAYNGGRLVAYAAMGVLMALASRWVAALPPIVGATARLTTAVVLGWALFRAAKRTHCDPRRMRTATGAFALGLLQGIAPCPPFVAAVALALTSARALSSVVLFLSLFAGTALFTLPVAFVEPIRRWRWLTSLMYGFGITACVYLTFSAVTALI